MQQNLCKTCGGNLYRVGNHYVCQSCGNKWSADAADDVHVVDRANAWAALRDGDFDHAAELFEIILEKEPKDYEAFWGLALAGAGIQYVMDMDDLKRVPTCHNIDEREFLNSKNVQRAIEEAPSEIASVYRQQAEQIERIRQVWREKARKEEPYDVFLSYKESDSETGERTRDSEDAYVLYQKLTQRGYRVFFSRESLKKLISEQFEPYIYNAIKTAKVMIVFGERPEHFNATWIRNEWSRFKHRIDNGEKHPNSLIMVTKNMNPKDLPASLRSRQAVDLNESDREEQLFDHIRVIVADAKKNEHIKKKNVESGKVGWKSKTIAQNTITTKDLGQRVASTKISEKQSLLLVETYIKEMQWEEANALLDGVLLENPNFAEAVWCRLLIRQKVTSNTVLMRMLDRFKPEDYALVERALDCASKEFAGLILDLFYESAKILPNQAREKVYAMILPYRYERREQRLMENFDWSISNHDFKFFKLLLTTLEAEDVDRYIEYNERYIKATADHQEKRECTDNILAVEEGNRVARMYLFESALTSANQLQPIEDAFKDVLKYSENIDADVEDAIFLMSAALNTPLHCEFAQQLPTYYQGDIKTLRRALMNLANRMLTTGFFEPARAIFGLMASVNENDSAAFWGVCLAKTRSKAEDQIINSPILLKDMDEYKKYLTLVDKERCVACVRLATKQKNLQRSRRRKRIRIVVGASVAALLVAGAVVTFTVIVPASQLEKANELFAAGDYAAAGELYQKLGDYNDSGKRAETVKAILQVKAANHAQAVEVLLSQSIPVEITYKAEGGLMAAGNASEGVAEQTNTYQSAAEFSELVTPAKVGYCFAGWETDTFSYDITGADPTFRMTLKATWTLGTYAVNYDLGGGTLLGEARKEFTIEDGDILIPEAEREGFEFQGWLYDGVTEPVKQAVIPAGSHDNVTFTAVWKGLSYKITLDYAAGGVEGPQMEELSIQCGQNLTLPQPQREGYVFDGWWEDGLFKVTDGLWERPVDVKLTAKWHIEEYAVKYHLQGGRVTESNPSVYTVESETIRLTAPTREGYTFLGWSPSADGSDPVKDVSIPKGSTGDLEYYAVWQANRSVVKLDPAGGTCDVTELTVVYGEQIKLNTPKWEHHTFVGWSLDGVIVSSGVCTITEDCTLVAQWEADTYTITYNLDGGRNHPSNPTTFTVDQTVTLLAPERVGYEFLGWEATGGDSALQQEVTIPAGTAKHLTYTACWKAVTSTISLNAKGGDCSTTELSVTYGTHMTLPQPTRSGYTFVGWYLGDQLVNNGVCILYENGELVAEWDPIQYSITYNGMEDGVNPSENPQRYTCEDTVTLKEPTRTGYTFLGWTYEGQSVPVKTVTIPAGEQGARSFTANWQIKTTVVTLSTAGGSDDGRVLNRTYNGSVSLPTPTRTGYTFAGWYDEDGLFVAQDGIWTRNEEALTLTARWSVNTYTVTFKDVMEYSNKRTITFDENYMGGQTYDMAVGGDQPLRYITPAERDNYVFAGWFTTSACESGTEFDFTADLTEDITLYAKWLEVVPFCNGTIGLNGSVAGIELRVGSLRYYAFVSPVSQYVTIYTSHEGGDPFLFLYDEFGVTTDEDLDGMHDDEHGNADAEITWAVEAGKVYYIGVGSYGDGVGCLYLETHEDMDGGNVGTDGRDGLWYTSGSHVTVEVQYDAELVLPTPSRDGYTFVGWYYNGEKLQSGTAFTLGTDAVLTAQWR